MSIFDWLGQYKEPIATLSVITTAVLAVWRYVVIKAYRQTMGFVSRLSTALSNVEWMAEQMKPNSGGSLRDKVDQMHEMSIETQRKLSLNETMTRAIASRDRRTLIMVFNELGQCTWVNDLWMHSTGLNMNQALGWGWLNGIIEADREQQHEAWTLAVEQRRDYIEEFRYRCIDTGDVIKVKDRREIVLNERKETIGWVSTATMVRPIPGDV
jgi:PAS domain-containing protein